MLGQDGQASTSSLLLDGSSSENLTNSNGKSREKVAISRRAPPTQDDGVVFAKLYIEANEKRGIPHPKMIALRLGRNVIGRGPGGSAESIIILPSDCVSQRHAVIEINQDGFNHFVYDLGSVNGTWIGPKPCSLRITASDPEKFYNRYNIVPGQVLRFADVTCRVYLSHQGYHPENEFEVSRREALQKQWEHDQANLGTSVFDDDVSVEGGRTRLMEDSREKNLKSSEPASSPLAAPDDLFNRPPRSQPKPQQVDDVMEEVVPARKRKAVEKEVKSVEEKPEKKKRAKREEAREPVSVQPTPVAKRSGRKEAESAKSKKEEESVKPVQKKKKDTHTPMRVVGDTVKPPDLEMMDLPRIAFSGLEDEELVKMTKIVEDLGGHVSDQIGQATHLVVGKGLKRTIKLMSAIARGLYIVSSSWLEKCRRATSFVDVNDHIVHHDKELEKKYKFDLKKAMQVSTTRTTPLFDGLSIFPFVKGAKLSLEDVSEIVKAGGGNVIDALPSKPTDKVVVVAGDDANVKEFVNKGFKVQTFEFLMSGVLHQELDWDRDVINALEKRRNKNYKKPPPHPMAVAHYVFDEATGLPIRKEIPKETRFWRIKDGFKVFKPISPGLRHRKEPALLDHWKGEPISRLTTWKSYSGGRNNSGKIVVRGRGGGGPRLLRVVDFERKAPGPQVVVRMEKDPYRSATLALIRHLATNELSYIIAPDGLKPGDTVESYRYGVPIFSDAEGVSKSAVLKRGNCLKLKDIPIGTVVHNIGLHPEGKAQLCRSAGTFGQVASFEQGKAQVRLQSGEVRHINPEAIATIGTVGNFEHHRVSRGKAGASRLKGKRPKVRGVAMNPNNHPHGGTRNKQGNRHPVSIWGWHTKGKRTRKRQPHVVAPRWKNVEKSST